MVETMLLKDFYILKTDKIKSLPEVQLHSVNMYSSDKFGCDLSRSLLCYLCAMQMAIKGKYWTRETGRGRQDC